MCKQLGVYLVGELFDSPLILAYSLLILLAFLLLGFQVILQFFHLPVNSEMTSLLITS